MKRCSASLIVREKQIKIAMTHHFTTTKKAISKETKSKCWQGYGKIEILVHCWWKSKMVQPLRKTVNVILKKQTELPYDPAILRLDIYSKKWKEQAQMNICTHVLSSIIHNIQKWKQAKYSSVDK